MISKISYATSSMNSNRPNTAYSASANRANIGFGILTRKEAEVGDKFLTNLFTGFHRTLPVYPRKNKNFETSVKFIKDMFGEPGGLIQLLKENKDMPLEKLIESLENTYAKIIEGSANGPAI